ncbi:UDP-glycosyltransferase 75C1-like [Curcuma longa]|uniref:UDP-glycosyltransferase 75C1-like n=1 Tax=Curcuma longa TaxID=136217 RepID=UPI003D9E37C2
MAQHFLVLTYPAQGHVNPALHLSRRLARTTSARVTFSTSIYGHRLMFPASAAEEIVEDGLVSYLPFSDGYDDGFDPNIHCPFEFHDRFRSASSASLAALLRRLDELGRPVTCIIYNMLFAWAGDVARSHGVRSAVYWIQPAAVFAIYYHYFHGYDGLIKAHSHDPFFEVNLPNLPPLKIRDLPSFLGITSNEDPYLMGLKLFEQLFQVLDREEADSTAPTTVLVNTFGELETEMLAVSAGKVKLIPVGPMAPPSLLEAVKDELEFDARGDLFRPDEKKYMEWLDAKPKRSVVYVSFGSLAAIKKRQVEEFVRWLRESEWASLWVVRKDHKQVQGELEAALREAEAEGMVVEWCAQARVLSHPVVGCFVTHCGWNSTLESLVCGVPTVALPQWTDQGTNALLMEIWGTGVRAKVDAEGVVAEEELRRCVEIAMGGGGAAEMRRSSEMWKDKAREAVAEGGSSDRNLRAFVAAASK